VRCRCKILGIFFEIELKKAVILLTQHFYNGTTAGIHAATQLSEK
jgi:hypothetical protein